MTRILAIAAVAFATAALAFVFYFSTVIISATANILRLGLTP